MIDMLKSKGYGTGPGGSNPAPGGGAGGPGAGPGNGVGVGGEGAKPEDMPAGMEGGEGGPPPPPPPPGAPPPPGMPGAPAPKRTSRKEPKSKMKGFQWTKIPHPKIKGTLFEKFSKSEYINRCRINISDIYK